MFSAQAAKVPPVWVKSVRVCVEGVLISVTVSARTDDAKVTRTKAATRIGEKARDAPRSSSWLARSWCIPGLLGPPQGESPGGDLRRLPRAVFSQGYINVRQGMEGVSAFRRTPPRAHRQNKEHPARTHEDRHAE